MYSNSPQQRFIDAVRYNNLGEVRALIGEVDVAYNDQLALRLAAQNGFVRILNLLLNHPDADAAARGNYAIIKAAEKGHAGAVEVLLTHPNSTPRVDPAADDDAPIHHAASNGHVDVVRLLLGDERVSPSTRDNFPLKMAVFNGHAEVVDLLMDDARLRLPEKDDAFYRSLMRQVAYVPDIAARLLDDDRFIQNKALMYAVQFGVPVHWRHIITMPGLETHAGRFADRGIARCDDHVVSGVRIRRVDDMPDMVAFYAFVCAFGQRVDAARACVDRINDVAWMARSMTRDALGNTLAMLVGSKVYLARIRSMLDACPSAATSRG